VLAEWVPDALAAEAVVPAAVVPAAVAPEAVVPAAVVPEAVVSEGLAVDGRAVVLDGGAVEAAAVGRGMWSPGAVVGLNVATDSIAPATRHTAKMLASSGMTVPRPAKGPASRRSRSRRRFARSSRR
jgi:hypothetical protein